LFASIARSLEVTGQQITAQYDQRYRKEPSERNEAEWSSDLNDESEPGDYQEQPD